MTTLDATSISPAAGRDRGDRAAPFSPGSGLAGSKAASAVRHPGHDTTALPVPGAALPSIGTVLQSWLGLFFSVVAAAVGIALALALLVLITATAVHARTPSAAERIQRDATAGGGLILQTHQGPVVAPLVGIDTELRVTGPTVRGVVKQRFINPQPDWIEGRYLFPLPEDAAVDHLRMRVGDRLIEGEIRERAAARREFEAARDAGQRAALVEQQRPNVFISQVTNIAPGAIIEVAIEYQQTIGLKDGRWQLRLPGVVAPRYSRPTREDAQDSQGPRQTRHEQRQTDDAHRPTDRERRQIRVIATANDIGFDPEWRPTSLRQGEQYARSEWLGVLADVGVVDDVEQPVMLPGERPINPMRIRVRLDAGLPVGEPRSSSHQIKVMRDGGVSGDSRTAWDIETLEGEIADRDFVLEWMPTGAAQPAATLRHEQRGDAHYGVVVVNPPAETATPASRRARDMTFVVDTSGSMGGESIEQARRALQFGLDRLVAGDRFNIIQFNSGHSSLFREPVPVTPQSIAQARRYVGSLVATGGTEMLGAIQQALQAPVQPEALGQVVFMTDGAVSYEDEMIAAISRQVGARRIYTVGIGSASNSYLMRKTAELGGGTFTVIGQVNEVESRMAALFEKLARPVYTDLAVTLDGGRLAEPITMPRDLHAGEPLMLAARFSELPRSLEVSAAGPDGRRWRIPVATAAAPGSGLHVRWARTEIERLSDEMRRSAGAGEGRQEALRGQILKLALDHHLVSRYTSLIAVDKTPARPADAPLGAGDVPANLPSGWRHDTTLGAPALAATATPASLQLGLGVLLLALGFAFLLWRRGARFLASGEAR